MMQSLRINRLPWLLPILFVICGFSPIDARASRLTMVGDSKLEIRQIGERIVLSGSYSIENRGDESAKAVFPTFEIGRWRWAGEPRTLEQGKRSVWDMREVSFEKTLLRCEATEKCAGGMLPDRGVFPVLVRRNYSDLNGYKFSAAEVLRVQLGDLTDAEQTALQVTPVNIRVSSRGNGETFILDVEINNALQRDITVDLAPFTSQEFRLESQPLQTLVKADSVGRSYFKLRNFSGLQGSAYAAFVVAQWQEGETRNTAAASAVLPIRTPDRSLWLVGGLIIAGILMAATLYYYVFSPRRGRR